MKSGQICVSTERIIIHKSLVERFIPRYVERVKAVPAGDPADPATIVGPLINTRGAQRVSKLVKDAAAKETGLLTGDGEIQGLNGTLIRQVVLTDMTTLNAALDVVSRVRSGIIHINDQGIGDEPMAPCCSAAGFRTWFAGGRC